jgi:hypothetical protein
MANGWLSPDNINYPVSHAEHLDLVYQHPELFGYDTVPNNASNDLATKGWLRYGWFPNSKNAKLYASGNGKDVNNRLLALLEILGIINPNTGIEYTDITADDPTNLAQYTYNDLLLDDKQKQQSELAKLLKTLGQYD